MAATALGMVGASILSGLGSGISGALQERTRQNEWNKMFDFQVGKQNFQQDFMNRQLEQQMNLGMRGQNLNFGGSLLNTGMNVGGSIIGNLLSYNHAQDVLNFQRDIHEQRRADIQNEGLPLSYLHLNGAGFQRSVPNIPMMRSQTFGRSVSNPWGYANSGTNLRDTWGPPPSYSAATGNINSPNTAHPAFDSVSGYPK